jgi:UPF0176 protein
MIKIVTFYKFSEISEGKLIPLKEKLTAEALRLGVKGLLLIGKEGCNATLSGKEEMLEDYKNYLQTLPEIGELVFKESQSENHPFKRFKVDIREEIVTLKDPNHVPEKANNNHLNPKEWQKVIESEDCLLLDTRNFYETEIGVFSGAVDLKLKKFSEFPEKVKELGLSKEKKILMYCTGGIRCEKAILDMQKEGFQNVFQLEGGILKYLEEFPEKNFEGECFVFDHRVAVDQNLQASKKYKLCPHCGNPANIKINCILCEASAIVCARCLESDSLHSCSKNCAYHAKIKLSKEKEVHS